jgi:hypothetical protein
MAVGFTALLRPGLEEEDMGINLVREEKTCKVEKNNFKITEL